MADREVVIIVDKDGKVGVNIELPDDSPECNKVDARFRAALVALGVAPADYFDKRRRIKVPENVLQKEKAKVK